MAKPTVTSATARRILDVVISSSAPVLPSNLDSDYRSTSDETSAARRSPVVCAAFEPVSKNLQLVCVNLAESAIPDVVADVGRMLDDPDEEFRSLGLLARRPRGDLDSTVKVISGSARAHHRAGGEWIFAPAELGVPGFIARIEIHR
jgi:hypothetical protein